MSLYSPNTDPKYQAADEPVPDVVPADVIVSEDTRRTERLPAGQHRTRKWPVLHATIVPTIPLAQWRLEIGGLVKNPLAFSLEEFRLLPRVKVFADFHCVTTWSRLGNLWEGVSLSWLLNQAGVLENAKFAVVGGYDNGWTTNLPLNDFLQPDCLLADLHDNEPISVEHGGPVRGLVPQLYAWKSAKWISAIELIDEDRAGYWEEGGYHMHGDPWTEERFRSDQVPPGYSDDGHP